jgi:hypothetical protein
MPVKVLVETGGTGKPTLVIERGGKRYPVYSGKDPARDGERFYRTFNAGGAELCLFIGLGLGYHIEPFLQEPKVRRVVVLEPHEHMFQAVRGCETVGRLLADGRVELYTGSQVYPYIEALKGRYDLLYMSGYRVVVYPPLRRIFHTLYGDLEKRLHVALSLLTGDALTVGRFARLWMSNFFKNLEEPGVAFPVSRLFGRWRGTAVVAGAGPSLNRTKEELKEKRQYFYLIATDASLKPLIRSGVKPDLVASCDPQPGMHFHVQGLQKEETVDIPAVLNPLSSHEIFMFFTRRYIHFTRHPTTELFRPMIPHIDELVINYQAVSSLALHLALAMGFHTVCLAGLDFSFPGVRAYAWDSYFYEYCVSRGTRMKTPYTIESGVLARVGDRKLRDYRSELELLIKGPAQERGVKVLNLSREGLAIGGARRVSSIPTNGSPEGASEGGDDFWEQLAGGVSRHTDERLTPVAETLALRNRLFRNAPSREQALERAGEWLTKKWLAWGKDFKV